ncbi:hypothetical protein [Methanosarcina sp. MSH10X1]|uniref:hypothetical protein n=1 Tax=Methanosarcina sp. MSH10X1 TaxID=2507075 RepID=UPI0013E40BAB|nr:hypothetical protein [Methanosarcina sp. MSH10X1]
MQVLLDPGNSFLFPRQGRHICPKRQGCTVPGVDQGVCGAVKEPSRPPVAGSMEWQVKP